MRVIFLDIDGVLNSQRSALAFTGFGFPDPEKDPKLDPVAVNILRKLVRETEAKIVVSSSWRLGSTVDELRAIFVNWYKVWEDAADIIIDMTPDLWKKTPYTKGKQVLRGQEVDAWLEAHPEVDAYVIFDDNSDFLPHQSSRFIQTDPNVGLTFDDYQRALAILLNIPEDDSWDKN